MSLRTYAAKRDFRRTGEPKAFRPPKTGADKPFFVVQKHDATRLHYDFRLAMGGVLKSWAVPKGFPTKKGDRRLAVQVEDHPMDYARFEGTIPEGNYGAGTVMVWDIGPYEIKGDDPIRQLEQGKLHFRLRGKKLDGEWTLVRMRRRGDEDKPQWLLLKSGGDITPISARRDDESVLTKRSLKKIAADNDAEWQSNRIQKRADTPVRMPLPARRTRRKRAVETEDGLEGNGGLAIDTDRLPKAAAEFVDPMKAVLAKELPKGPEWIYEIKFDGIRAIAIKNQSAIRLVSRNGKDLARKFPEVTRAAEELDADEAVLDGEIVALDNEGRSSFQLLQSHEMQGLPRPPIYYYVFDLIELNGRDLRTLPLSTRKAMLEKLTGRAPENIRFSAGIQAESERLLREMKSRGLEGLIAKRKDSRYETGRRSGAWTKFKWSNEQEFVIGGYTPPKGTRSHFGAILVGYHDKGKLLFASKVGTGFDERMLNSLYSRFQKLVQRECPFANLPERPGLGGRGGFTTAEMRRCAWLKPKLVCEVRFAEWTRDGHLRQPAFLGLREDKEPEEVVRETVE